MTDESLADGIDAALALTQPSTWSATSGTSADPTAVTVSTTSSAAKGNYAIQVQNLAASQSTVSGFFASAAAPVGAGTMHIDLGKWNSTAFTVQLTSRMILPSLPPAAKRS